MAGRAGQLYTEIDGEVMRRLRTHYDWTQAEAAEAAGVHPSTYATWESVWEQGARRESIDRLARTWGVPVCVLVRRW